ncbi:MAG: L,D-transpeptidase family protein [Candidatus Hydrogenedentes bacterium]|nr:L,D-transpeptidase family protein [Candidatus Hydrogenedentota bacterium]
MAQQSERRSAPRAAIERQAMFVAVDGSTLLQAGAVTDMSRDGLHLRTRQPAPIGTIIEIEMEPREGSAQSKPIIIRGRVVRIQELPGGEFSVGVKLRYRVGKANAVPARAATPARVLTPATTAEARRKTPHPQKLDWRHGAMIGFFAGVIALLLLWPRDGSPRAAASGASGERTSLDQVIAEIKQRPKNQSSTGSGGAAQKGYSTRPAVPSSSIVQRTRDRVSTLDERSSATRNGRNTSGALESVRSDRVPRTSELFAANALGLSPAIDGAMLAGGARQSDSEYVVGTTGDSSDSPRNRELAAIVRALDERAASEFFESTRAAESALFDPVHIEVDQDAYTLTVYRAGKPFTEFPISVGSNRSTPKGTFTIHNKIRNPDWYDRGKTVPYGDPRNPLGASWMGFAKNGQPLSYGIHPTNDLGAMGQPAGRGCVRLKPEHAEALFRICPVGATVTIR